MPLKGILKKQDGVQQLQQSLFSRKQLNYAFITDYFLYTLRIIYAVVWPYGLPWSCPEC